MAATRTRWWRRVVMESAGVAVLGGLWLCLTRVDQFDPLLYRGGFLGAAVLAGLAVVIASHPRSWVAAGLGMRPLVWLGRRSYGCTCGLWPVFMLTRPHSDVPLTGTPLLGLRIAITLALATASYRWVEKPIREGALGRAWSETRAWAGARAGLARRSRPPATATRWALGGVVAMVAVGTAILISHPVTDPPFVVPAAASASPAAGSDSAGAPALQTTITQATADPTVTPVATATGGAAILEVATETPGVVVPEPAPVAADPAPAPAPEPVAGPPAGTRVTAIGESVMIVAQPAMEAEGIYVDALIGRQFDESLAVAHALRDSGGWARS